MRNAVADSWLKFTFLLHILICVLNIYLNFPGLERMFFFILYFCVLKNTHLGHVYV
jgi:hypothetical protein